MKKINVCIILILGWLLFPAAIVAQEEKPAQEEEGYVFTIIKELPVTPVENQFRSGTCWSYSGISFLESELLRHGKGEYNLSEMFVVYHSYMEKARKYVRMHGNIEFAGGGAFHDVLHVIATYGMVPEEVYTGLVIGEDNPVHGEMDKVLNAYVDGVVANPNGKLTPVWDEGFKALLDAYLGEIPQEFTYKGKSYTPQRFAESLGLDMDDYVEIGSYTHHPFYEPFILEVPDNWAWGEVYNVPVGDLEAILDYSLDNGYTVAWGADVSEKGFSWKNGLAVVPDHNVKDMSGTEKERWEKLTEKEKQEALYKFDKPGTEKTITQEMRQDAFDNYSMTDDHGMLITGKATDQNGSLYYLVKNSWGTDGKYKGYFYASKPFVLMNTIDIMVHRDAIPKNIRETLGLK